MTNTSEQEDFKKQTEHYKDMFGLSNWSINYVFHPTQVELHRAKTLANPTYNVATLTVYPLLLNKREDWDEVILHELIHIVMAMYDFFVDNAVPDEETTQLMFFARENAVSQLTSVITRILKIDKVV